MQWTDRTAAHGTIVLGVSGDVGATSLGELRRPVSRYLAQGHLAFVMDLSAVRYFDWSGIKGLAGLRLPVTGRGGTFGVAGGSSVRRAIVSSRFEHALGLCPTPGKAVLACAPEPFLRADQSVCDWCGAVVPTGERVDEIVRDSSAEYPGDPLLEGARTVVGCGHRHVTALVEHYGARPYSEVEAWAARVDRVVEDKGESFSGLPLADAVGLDLGQLRRALAWRAGHDVSSTA
ncbi:STAS domain-containing protein [Streptomyces sp. HUAS MG91]|uniref:STAS domain-containing protein n=1 Tax=Streptomyces tabacisoli TaxID=3156398 RepID=A0AAU8J3F5_9ACTN